MLLTKNISHISRLHRRIKDIHWTSSSVLSRLNIENEHFHVGATLYPISSSSAAGAGIPRAYPFYQQQAEGQEGVP